MADRRFRCAAALIIAVLVSVLGGAWRWRTRRSDPLLRLLALFAILSFAGLPLLATKYARYLYPLLTGLSIPTAVGIGRVLPVDARRRGARLLLENKRLHVYLATAGEERQDGDAPAPMHPSDPQSDTRETRGRRGSPP